jgi:hypothetical protein
MSRCLGVLVACLIWQTASAQQGGVIGFTPVKSLYTANPNYLATNSWGNMPINGVDQPYLALWTPNPRNDYVCPDYTNNYYGDAAKMTGLSIPVTPNTNYTIAATIWILDQTKGTWVNVNPSLSFRVNGQAVKMNSFPLDKWTTVTGTWNSGSSTVVSSLGIWDDQGAGCGNDYYIAGAATQVVPAIAVSKTASSNPLPAGSTGSFSIKLAITGGTTTTPVTLTDALPAGLSLSATPSLVAASTSSAGASLACTTGAGATTASCTIASGAGEGNIVINVPVNIAASTASSITNVASVSGGTANCTGTPCTGSVTVGVASARATLRVSKALGAARIKDTDQFTVQILQDGTTVVNDTTNSTTTGNGATVDTNTGMTGTTNLVANTSYTIKEITSGTSNLAQYDSTLGCTDSAGGVKALPLNAPFTLQGGDVITCTLTNTPKAPTLRLTKALGTGGRINNADQFTVQILQRLTETGNGTTSGTGSTISAGSTGWVSLVAGSSYNLTEVMTGASVSKIGQYDGVVTCTNGWTGSPTVVSTVPGTAFTPTYGDALDCMLTNTAKPAKMALTQLVISPFPVNLLPPFTFNYSINNGWPVNPQALTTATLNVPVSSAQQTLAARNVDTTLSTSLPDTRWFVSSFACTDGNAPGSGNATGNLVRVVASSVTIPAANVRAGAALKCTLIMGHKVP